MLLFPTFSSTNSTLPRFLSFASLEKNKGLPDKSDYPLGDPRFRFMNAVVYIVLKIYYRAEWVKKEKRITKTYGENIGEWISVEEAQPPEGVPLIVMVKRESK